MNLHYLLFGFLIILALVIGACGGSGQSVVVGQEKAPVDQTEFDMDNIDEKIEEGSDSNFSDTLASDSNMNGYVSVDEFGNDEAMDKMAEDMPSEMNEQTGMIDLPAYFTATLVNASSGKTFEIEDFKGM